MKYRRISTAIAGVTARSDGGAQFVIKFVGVE